MSMQYTPTLSPFQSWPTYHAPHVAEGHEVPDPKKVLEPSCMGSCSSWTTEYNQCVNRIALRTDGKGNCQTQYEELGMCVDHCIAHDIFDHVK